MAVVLVLYFKTTICINHLSRPVLQPQLLDVRIFHVGATYHSRWAQCSRSWKWHMNRMSSRVPQTRNPIVTPAISRSTYALENTYLPQQTRGQHPRSLRKLSGTFDILVPSFVLPRCWHANVRLFPIVEAIHFDPPSTTSITSTKTSPGLRRSSMLRQALIIIWGSEPSRAT